MKYHTYNKSIFLALIVYFLIAPLRAQKVTGTITNREGNPKPYIQLLITSQDSLRYGAITAVDGTYTIGLPQNGIYHMKIFNFSKVVYQDSLRVNGTLQKDIAIEDQMGLDEVTIEVQKPLIENKVDRLVFNLENSVVSEGLDLTEALKLTPLLQVSESSVSIVGKSGVNVMVNGRMLQLSGTELINYLRSLRSDNVKSIEVITAPPAKYEAQGNSGIINILLKPNPKTGFSGSISSSYIQTTYPGYTNNLTINYNSDKISSSLRIRQYDRTSAASENINVLGNVQSILSADDRKDNYNGYGANLSLDYKTGERSHTGFIYDIGQTDNKMNIDNTTRYLSGVAEDSLLITNSTHQNPTTSHTLNTYHDITLDKEGASLNFIGNYFANLPENTVEFTTRTRGTPGRTNVQNLSDINYQIWSLQSDLTLPTSFADLEFGIKFTDFNNNSELQYFEAFNNEDFVLNFDRSNTFEYDEQNLAGYGSFRKGFNEFWTLKAGLRYEYSLIDTYSPTTNERGEMDYGNWFPSVYLSYKPSNIHFAAINYTKRINRPGFRALNPFRWYSNPYSYYTGNPSLQPSYNHNFEISYSYKNFLTIKAYSQLLKNGFGRIVTVTDDNNRIVNYFNYLEKEDYGLTLSISHKPTNWWSTYFTANGSYSTATSSNAAVVPRDGYSIYYRTNNNLTISKAKNLMASINFWHLLPATDGNTESDGISSLSLGLRMPLIKEKLQLSVSVNDIFKESVSTGTIYFDDYIQTYDNYYDSRRLSFSLTYQFGKEKVHGNSKRIQFDEKQRGN